MRVLVACEYSGRVREAFRALGHDAWSCDLLPADDGSPFHYWGDVRDILDGWAPVRFHDDCDPGDELGYCDATGNAFADCSCYGPTQDDLEYGERSGVLVARPVSNPGWDLMIAHPPCTYLTCAAEWAYGDGPYHQKVKPGTLVGEARRAARVEALAFVETLWNAPIPRIAIENPVGVLSSRFGKPAQTIQPWMFGDDASKATCLWLRGLSPLADDPAAHHPGRLVEHNGKLVRRWANQTDGGQNKLPPSADRWKERSVTYQGIADAMAAQWGAPSELPLFASTTPRTLGASSDCPLPIPAIREGCSK